MGRQTEEFKEKKGRGRPKGSQNKVTLKVKEAMMEAFEKAGGVQYLVALAHEDPRTFCTLLGKMIPVETDITSSDGTLQPVTIQVVGIDADSTD